MIDPQTEQLISFSEAAKLLPSRTPGKRVHVKTMYRWARLGFRGVALEFLAIGCVYMTSAEAVTRFLRRTTEATGTIAGRQLARAGRTLAERERDQTAAERELTAAGI